MRREWMRIYREQSSKGRNMQNARLTGIQKCRSKGDSPGIILFESLANKQRLCSFAGNNK